MTYFSYFPKLLTKSTGSPIIIPDFFHRVHVSDKFRDQSVVLDDYFVLDGETPEIVSNKIYGTPFNHWVILLVNSIVNPREEWPVSQKQLVDRIYLRYPFEIEVPDSSLYNIDDEVTSNNGGSFVVTNVDSDNDVISLLSLTGKIILTTSNTLSNITADPMLTGLAITSLDTPLEVVHHYVNVNTGYIMDYDIGNPEIVPVTNWEYEESTNDEKRTVKVLNPAYLTFFISEFKNKIG